MGVSLFQRHTRSVELTNAGPRLLPVVFQSLPRIDDIVRQIRQSTGRGAVSINGSDSLVSMWLIPRLQGFLRDNPEIDIRVDTSATAFELEHAHVDITLRYGEAKSMSPHAVRLFGEQLTPVATRRLLRTGRPVKAASDVAQFPLVEIGDVTPPFTELTWQHWFVAHGVQMLQPRRWAYFNYSRQIAQAALANQGVALARLPLVLESIASGDLVEPLPKLRMSSALAYFLVTRQSVEDRPEVQLFRDWMIAEAAITREVLDEG